MAGIEEVAKLAGVSTATVSRALSGRGHVSPASKAKVDEAAARLGYVVSSNASSLASGRTRNIGVVIPFLNRWFFSSVLEGAQHELLRRGYDLTLYNLSGEDRPDGHLIGCREDRRRATVRCAPVSYTHLTLPTILLV